MIRGDQYQDLPEAVNLNESYFELSSNILKEELKKIKYYARNTLLRDKNKDEVEVGEETNVFSCAMREEVENFYVTFGFLDDHYFIYRRKYSISLHEMEEGSMNVEIILDGIMEPTPELMKFRDRQHLEKVFISALNNQRKYNSA